MSETSAEKYSAFYEIANRIDQLLFEIKEDTKFHSNLNYVTSHPSYIKLIDMGEKIIPYLFRCATQHGASWIHFALFAELSKENPIPPEDNGRFERILMHWLRWYTENSKYQNLDVYYGLCNSP